MDSGSRINLSPSLSLLSSLLQLGFSPGTGSTLAEQTFFLSLSFFLPSFLFPTSIFYLFYSLPPFSPAYRLSPIFPIPQSFSSSSFFFFLFFPLSFYPFFFSFFFSSPFSCFFFSLSSLCLILLVSSSFPPPLSFLFFFQLLDFFLSALHHFFFSLFSIVYYTSLPRMLLKIK